MLTRRAGPPAPRRASLRAAWPCASSTRWTTRWDVATGTAVIPVTGRAVSPRALSGKACASGSRARPWPAAASLILARGCPTRRSGRRAGTLPRPRSPADLRQRRGYTSGASIQRASARSARRRARPPRPADARPGSTTATPPWPRPTAVTGRQLRERVAPGGQAVGQPEVELAARDLPPCAGARGSLRSATVTCRRQAAGGPSSASASCQAGSEHSGQRGRPHR